MGTGKPPCAGCKLLRRRCNNDCLFAPYFPSGEPEKFGIVHKVFGASNVGKMLKDIQVHQRGDAVKSLVYEASARGIDPVYGCVGTISCLQNEVVQLQMQLQVAKAEIRCMQMQHIPNTLLIDHNHNDQSNYFLQNPQLLPFTSPNANAAANIIYNSL